MNLYVLLGGYVTIAGEESSTERTIVGLKLDNFRTADYYDGEKPGNRWYIVKKPDSSSESGLSLDGKGVYLSDVNTPSTMENPVDLFKIIKHIDNLIYNMITKTIRRDPNWVDENGNLKDLKVDQAIELPSDTPMAFKRANTVVNLGRL